MHDIPRFGRRATRRDVLRTTLAGLGLAALGPWQRGLLRSASGAVASQTMLTLVNMFGGCDSLNMIIPTTRARYYERRPTIQIPVGQQLALTGGPRPTSAYTLHPRLTRVRDLWNDGDAAIVTLVGYPDPNGSHFESEDIWSSALRQGAGGLSLPPSGWIARYADRNAEGPLGVMSLAVGRRRDFGGGSTNPLLLGRLRDFRFLTDGAYTANHAHRLATVREMLRRQPSAGLRGEARSALDTAHTLVDQVQAAQAAYSSSVVYPATGLAGSLKDAARVVQAGFPTRILYTGFGGFDTHSEQNAIDGTGAVVGSHANLMGTLDGALGAYADDLKAMGAWQNMVIVVISEFGRNNFENGSLGTDHGHALSVLVLGGAVNGGVHGPDITDAMLDENELAHQVDFRDVYRAIVGPHLGAAGLDAIFPEAQPIQTALGLV